MAKTVLVDQISLCYCDIIHDLYSSLDIIRMHGFALPFFVFPVGEYEKLFRIIIIFYTMAILLNYLIRRTCYVDCVLCVFAVFRLLAVGQLF
jgi:hypothetical protein